MAKFSVKKPLTIFVAVVAILVLGAVSYMNMTPDLLPNINLPYVMVITPVPGGTPEKVETTVTKPLEQSMASLEHIESVSSTSSENSSIIFLEFGNDVDLDTVTVDILQRTTQMEEYWDDTVGTPTIMKLNPSMLPVMVLAVDMEGMDTEELSRFTEDNLLSNLEGVPGVASVDASGLVAESIEVALRQERIDTLNRRVKRAIEAEFAEGEEELDEARDEVVDGLDEVEGAMDELQGAMDEASGMVGEATSQISQKEMELMQTKMMLLQQVAALTQQLEQLNQTEQVLQGVLNGFSELDARSAEMTATITQLRELLAQIDQLNETVATIAGQLENPDLSEEERAALDQTMAQAQAALATIDAQLAAQGTSREALAAQISTLETSLRDMEASYSGLNATLAELGFSRADLEKTLAELQDGKAQLTAGIAQMQNALTMLDAGTMTIAQAKGELEKQKLEGIIELSSGSAQLILAESELNGALEQIDEGLEQLDDARQEAFDKADLDNIVTVEMISQILFAENFTMPAGYVEDENGIQTLVRVGDAFTSMEELENLMLLDLGLDGLDPIYLNDVADISLVSNSGGIYAKINGRDGVLLSMTKQSTYATAEVTENIAAELDELAEEYPGLSYVSLMDQGDYIRIIISAILQNLMMGAAFAILVLFFFLRDIRPTFITLCSIPISVIFAIALMYFSGVTINIISLSGLAVGVGMLVDNSVVVIENIYRLRSRGENVIKAAVSGATQVSGAITASTLTTICVFLPIVFTEGLTRQLFTDMALTLGYSLIASLIVALTLVPAMSSALLKNAQPKESRVFDKVLGLYEKMVRGTLNHKLLVLAGSAALLVVSVLLILLKGYIFMPEMDMPEVTASLEAPEGSTTEETMAYADDVSERILELDGVETVGAMLSSTGTGLFGDMGGGSSGEDTSVTLYILLGEKESGIEASEAINKMFSDYPCEVKASGASSMSDYMSALGGSGVAVDVYGDDMNDLLASARRVAEVLEGVEGTQNVQDGIGDTEPEIRFVVDKNKAMENGLTVAQVYAEVSAFLSTENTATSITLEKGETDVIVLSPQHDTLTPGSIRNFSFEAEDFMGEKHRVYLRDIADIEETETATSIGRINQRRYVTVSAEVGSEYNVGLVSTAAERALQAESFPDGVTYEISGESTTILDAFGDLALMLLLGVLLVYLIMVAQFQSLKSPFIVMFTIPLAFTGGLFALLIAGMELSVIAAIGFVMLVGIIVNNGIVLVDYINQLRAEGAETREAVVEAGKTRMRPILMTSTTTILGLSTMAIGLGTGGELMQPIAVVCIGGLVYATILTLFVVPVMYELLNRKAFRVIDEEDLTISEL